MINFYKTKNINKTKIFYQRLTLSVYFENENSIILDSGDGMLGFVLDINAEVKEYSCISFDLASTTEVDLKYEQLKDIALNKPSMHPNFPVYSFFLKDPNGLNIEFQTIIR